MSKVKVQFIGRSSLAIGNTEIANLVRTQGKIGTVNSIQDGPVSCFVNEYVNWVNLCLIMSVIFSRTRSTGISDTYLP